MAEIVTSLAETAEQLVTKPAKGSKTAEVKEPKAPSKMDLARAVFAEMPGASRKDVIARFVAEVGLTEKGASTYYQSIKGKRG